MNGNEPFSDNPASSSAQNPEEIVHHFVDEQGRSVYFDFPENPYYFEENGTEVLYEDPYEPVAPEIYHEETVVTYPGQVPNSRPTNKSVLLKDLAPCTVLLTNQSLDADRAQFISKSGKKCKSELEGQTPSINQDGSSLNRNLPGMKNMFKVMQESALLKANEFLDSVKTDDGNLPVEPAKPPKSVAGDVDDDEHDTPPPMEKIVDDGSEFMDSCFDQWPLYSNHAIDFKEACELLIGILPIEKEKICNTVPLQFKHEGTFFIDTRNVRSCLPDENGDWERPSGKMRYYYENEWGNLVRADDGKGRLKEGITTVSYKITLKRYENKTTKTADDGRGQFQKKIYTGMKGNQKMTFAIVTYSWFAGRPWNFVPPMTDRRIVKKTNWEKKSFDKVNMTEMPQVVSAFYDGFNLYSHCVVTFDEAAMIMLGATPVDNNKICSSVPLGYRQNGTFVIDLKRMGHCLLELRRDDNGLWSKPSGFSRFYKFAESGDAVRVDKTGKLPAGVDYDVKLASKRYEHHQVQKKFVRKIYTAKGKNSDTWHGSPELAVIVYYWKGEPIQFEPHYKQNMVNPNNKEFARFQQMAEVETEYVEAAGAMDDVQGQEQMVMQEEIHGEVVDDDMIDDQQQPSMKRARYDPQQSNESVLEMKMALIRREMENQDRFAAVLDRADSFLTRLEHRFGVDEETVYTEEEPIHDWAHQEIIEEEVIHTDYHHEM